MIHVLLAAYNEGAALPQVLEGVARTLADGNYRVWVVDDGSQDNTAAAAREWSTRIPLTLLRHAQNAGLGKALQTGLSHIYPVLSPTDVVVTLDADHTHPPQIIPHLTQPVENNSADLVIASRFAEGGKTVGVPFFRRLTSAGAYRLFRFFFPIPNVRDYTCGFRAYRGELLLRGRARWGNLISENGFAAMVEWLIKLSVLSPQIKEVPLVLRYDRKPTPSKMPVCQTIWRTLVLLKKLRNLKGSV